MHKSIQHKIKAEQMNKIMKQLLFQNRIFQKKFTKKVCKKFIFFEK